jgi:hypothetical protein
MRSQGILLKAETGQEQKQKKLQLFQKPWTEKINEFLNEDQRVKYKALNEERGKKIKKK